MVVDVRTYQPRVSRRDLFWLVFVPEINYYTQARNFCEVEPMARDLIAVMRDVAADSFTLEVSVELLTAGTPPAAQLTCRSVPSWSPPGLRTRGIYAAEAAARFGAVVGEAA